MRFYTLFSSDFLRKFPGKIKKFCVVIFIFFLYNGCIPRERRKRMHFRHEMKIEISLSDCMQIRMRLNAVMKKDAHGENGRYEIRSLYFDNIEL